MAIPASVTLYVRWTNGQPLSGTTYTAVAPDVPVGHTYTFNNSASLAVEAGSPWNGQYLAQLDTGTRFLSSTVSSSTVQATSGRILIEVAPLTVSTGLNENYFRLYATTSNNGEVRVRNSTTDTVNVLGYWSGGNQVNVSLGAEPSNPFNVEIIYDTNNATASLRMRARMWEIGSSVPSFTDIGAGSVQNTTDQFTTVEYGDGGGAAGLKANRLIISNDITEDLSAVTESSTNAYAFQ